MTICEQVAERVALGEPVGEADHVASCVDCQATVALATQLATARHPADPGVGFSARMTVGAQKQIVRRRHRRYVATGLAAMVASAAFAVVVMVPSSDPDVAPVSDKLLGVATNPATDPTHDHDRDPKQPPSLDPEHDPWAPHDVDPDTNELVQLADTDAALSMGADWNRIEAPLAPYRNLEGVK